MTADDHSADNTIKQQTQQMVNGCQPLHDCSGSTPDKQFISGWVPRRGATKNLRKPLHSSVITCHLQAIINPRTSLHDDLESLYEVGTLWTISLPSKYTRLADESHMVRVGSSAINGRVCKWPTAAESHDIIAKRQNLSEVAVKWSSPVHPEQLHISVDKGICSI